MEWYQEYQHIGYNLQGEKIGKKEQGDQVRNKPRILIDLLLSV